jgi:N-acyl-D-amino-acid deacylase
MQSAPDEAAYYDYPGAPLAAAMPGLAASAQVPAPYGGFALETADSYGAWIGAPVDFLELMLAVDGTRGRPLLSSASRAAMLTPARLPGGQSRYGLGAFLTPVRAGTNWWHTGSQPGEFTLAVRSAEGHAWVAAFNMRPRNVDEFFGDLDRTIWQAARSIREWPGGDLRASQPH